MHPLLMHTNTTGHILIRSPYRPQIHTHFTLTCIQWIFNQREREKKGLNQIDYSNLITTDSVYSETNKLSIFCKKWPPIHIIQCIAHIFTSGAVWCGVYMLCARQSIIRKLMWRTDGIHHMSKETYMANENNLLQSTPVVGSSIL